MNSATTFAMPIIDSPVASRDSTNVLYCLAGNKLLETRMTVSDVWDSPN